MHFQEIIKTKKTVGRGIQRRRFAKIIIKKTPVFWEKNTKHYFVLRFLLKKIGGQPKNVIIVENYSAADRGT